MIRLLIAGLMVLMAGNANAVTNEDLLEDCAIYADNNYKAKDLASAQCTAYFRGIADLLNDLCLVAKVGDLSEETKVFLKVLGSDPISIKAPVQEYINQMKANPKKWKDSPAFHVGQAFRDIHPCK